MVRRVEKLTLRKGGEQCMDCIWTLERGFLCVSGLHMRPRESRKSIIKNYWSALQIRYRTQVVAEDYHPAFSFFLLPSISHTPLSFMQYLLTQINREWKKTKQKNTMAMCFCLTHIGLENIWRKCVDLHASTGDYTNCKSVPLRQKPDIVHPYQNTQ